MKFERTNKVRGVKAAFLLMLFLFIWSSSNLFFHSHTINSEVVTHSHPYTNTNHSHTSLEFQTLAMLSLSLVLAVWPILHLACYSLGEKSERYQYFKVDAPFKGAIHLLRAPPTVC